MILLKLYFTTKKLDWWPFGKGPAPVDHIHGLCNK